MPTYYGYAERDANSYVDWGKIGQNLTETVQTAYQIREEKKAALDKIMQENYAELANSPTGENTDINKAVVQHVDNTKQYLLQINKLLKAGVLQPKDYTLIMQNQKEDTKAIFDNAKNWQDAFKKILDETSTNGTGSLAMRDLASDVAAFGKFKDMQFMITPTTGRVSAAQFTKDTNGNIVKGDTKSMQQLNVLMNQKIDKYKLTEKLVNFESVVGENQISKFTKARRGKNGEIVEIQDKETKDSFDKITKTLIEEVTSNKFNSLSILKDFKGTVPDKATIDLMEKNQIITAAEANNMRSVEGKPYRVSTNPQDAGKADVIMYVDKDGDGSYEPVLENGQQQTVEKYVVDQFLGLIDHKEETAAVAAIADYHKTDGEANAETKKYNGEMFGQNVANAVYGRTQEDIDKGIRGMAGLGNIKYALSKEIHFMFIQIIMSQWLIH